MRKYSVEEKLRIIKLVLEDKHSITSTSTKEGIDRTTLAEWIRNYEVSGIETFLHTGNAKRTASEKEMAVQEYLSGQGSLREICKKHKISSTRTLRQWISLYNGHKELKASGTGGRNLMTEGRKTTFEERIEIVQFCIANRKNYGLTMDKFDVSYQQIYLWVRKYEENGVDGLLDRRGKAKPENELTELDRLKAENKMLAAKNQELQMEIDVIKKLKEVERRYR